MKYLAVTLIVVGVFAAAYLCSDRTVAAGQSCESLPSLMLPDATITLARTVDAGAFALPTPVDGAAPAVARNVRVLPAFCRVAATLKPSSDSDIKIELWLPTANWNGKFQAVGNGAWNGTIAYPAMMTALGRGYATSSTDTGHTGGNASFALGHPEKVIDFGYRAVHEMTVTSKAIIAAFYDASQSFRIGTAVPPADVRG